MTTPHAKLAGRRRRRACLTCGVVVILLLVLLVAGWRVISPPLLAMLGPQIQRLAAENINGRLEYDELRLSLNGRAVLTDARVYLEDADEPVISCPRCVVDIGLLSLLSRRRVSTVGVTVYEPHVVLVRERDGSFNLARLAKPREEEAEAGPLRIAVAIRDGQVALTDRCLLSQVIPDYEPDSGPASEILDELGFSQPLEQSLAHQETLGLDGRVTITTADQMVAGNVDITRTQPGGQMRAWGRAALDGTEIDAKLRGDQIELVSLDAYIQSAAPLLAVHEATADPPPGAQEPYAAGLIRVATVTIAKQKGEDPSLGGAVVLRHLRFGSRHLPALYLPDLDTQLDAATGDLVSQLTLMTAGCIVDGKLTVGTSSEALDGMLALSCPSPRATLEVLGVSGSEITGEVRGNLAVGGSLAEPAMSLVLESDPLYRERLQLGRLRGIVDLAADQLVRASLQLTGGALPLAADGAIDLRSLDGAFDLTSGSLAIARVAEIADQLGADRTNLLAEATGFLIADGRITVRAGRPEMEATIASTQLSVGQLDVRDLAVRLALDGPNLVLPLVAGKLVTPVPWALPGENGDELIADLRASGSVGGLFGAGTPSLEFAGGGEASGLLPDEVQISFKASGPVDDIALRGQLKSAAAERPLLLSVSGNYRPDISPLKGDLHAGESTAELSGSLDFDKQSIDLEVQADSFELADIPGNELVRGSVTLTAKVGGSLTAPVLQGTVAMPLMRPADSAYAIALKDLAAEFTANAAEGLTLDSCRFAIEDNQFALAGTVGAEYSDLVLDCPDLALASVLVAASGLVADSQASELVHSIDCGGLHGPLTASLTGSLLEPAVQLSYNIAPAEPDSASLTSLVLDAEMSLAGVDSLALEALSRGGGELSLEGEATFKPFTYSATARAGSFELAALHPLVPAAFADPAAELSGSLDGQAEIEGSLESSTGSGSFSLREASAFGVPITTARAEFAVTADAVELRDAAVVAENTDLRLRGRLAYVVAESSLTAAATSFDLRHLAVLLPDQPPLEGLVSWKCRITPGDGRFPDAEFELASLAEDLGYGGYKVSSIEGSAALQDDIITIEQLTFREADSSLQLSAAANAAILADWTPDRRLELDVTVESADVQLADVRAMLPANYGSLVPDGSVRSEGIELSGSHIAPQLSGTIDFALAGGAAGSSTVLPFASAEGRMEFGRDSFAISPLLLALSEPGLAGGAVDLAVDGTYKLRPPHSYEFEMSIQLGDGTPVQLDTSKLLAQGGGAGCEGSDASGPAVQFDGWLGGDLLLRASYEELYGFNAAIGGYLVVNQEGEESTLKVASLGGGGGESTPMPLSLDELRIEVIPGTSVEMKQGVGPASLALRAGLAGEVTLDGNPGMVTGGGSQALSVAGTLDLPEGSVTVFSRRIALDPGRNRLVFRGMSGDPFPYLTAKATLVLKHVLGGAETLAFEDTTSIGFTSARDRDDLRIHLAFTDHRLDDSTDPAESVHIYSSPPLPQEQVMSLLVSGALAPGAGGSGLLGYSQQDILAFGGSYIGQSLVDMASEAFQRELDLEELSVGGLFVMDEYSYLSVDVGVTPELLLSYYREDVVDGGQLTEYVVMVELLDDYARADSRNLGLTVAAVDEYGLGFGMEYMLVGEIAF